MKLFLYFFWVLLFTCLQAKKSGFDLSSKIGANFGLFFGLNSGSTSTSSATTTSTSTSSLYSVGGSITGFSSGSLILQLNGGSDNTINSTSTTYQFTASLNTGDNYSITIKSNPTGLGCSVSNSSGTISNSNITNVNINCAAATVSALYPNNGSKWNDYIKNSGSDVFSANDTACAGTETGTATNGGTGYRLCLHGGEFKKLDVPSRTSCTNLTASDSASALNWVCKTNSSGSVSFYSTGLSRGKYLSDLIDWNSNSWKSISVTVLEGTTTHLSTNSAVLWTNPINSTNATTLNTSSTIYLYNSSPLSLPANSISPSADKIAIVGKPDLTIRLVPSSTCSTFGVGSTKKFLWFEGSFIADQSNTGLQMNTAFSVAKNIKIQSTAATCSSSTYIGVSVQASSGNNYLSDIVVGNVNTGSASYGIFITSGSINNFIENAVVFQIGTGTTSGGIYIDTSSTGNTILNSLAFNTASSGFVNVPNDSALLNITSLSHSGNGFLVNSNSGFTLITNMVASNNANAGLSAGGSTWSSSTVQNFAGSDNANNLIYCGSACNNIRYTGIFKSASSPNCVVAGTNPGVTGSGCTQTTPSDFGSVINITGISSTFRGIPNLATALNDSKNSSSGLNTNGGVSPTDWINFENQFRGIGKYNAASFPNALHRGNCSGSGCSLFDFSLRSSDAAIRNVNSCPTTTITHTWSSGSTVTFLRNSVELINDGVGDDDGYCEQNENCLYTPNIGAYQGHGSIVSSSSLSGGCADASSLGIKLFQYQTNGY